MLWAQGCWDSRAVLVLLCAMLLILLFDVAYLARAAWTVFAASRTRRDLMAPGSLSFAVSPFDVDVFGHLNNAKYNRLCDFGRIDMLVSSGLARIMKGLRVTMVLGGITIRYRRELHPFALFSLNSRVLCWDAKCLYVEQTFVRNGFVHAIAIARLALVAPAHLPAASSITVGHLIALLAGLDESESPSPAFPEDVSLWLRSNEVSSAALRAPKPSQVGAAAVSKRE